MLIGQLIALVCVPLLLMAAGWIFYLLVEDRLRYWVEQRRGWAQSVGSVLTLLALFGAFIAIYLAGIELNTQRTVLRIPVPEFIPVPFNVPAPRLSLGLALLFSTSVLLLPLSWTLRRLTGELLIFKEDEYRDPRLQDLSRVNEALFFVALGVAWYKILAAFLQPEYLHIVTVIAVMSLTVALFSISLAEGALNLLSLQRMGREPQRPLRLRDFPPVLRFLVATLVGWWSLTLIAWY